MQNCRKYATKMIKYMRDNIPRKQQTYTRIETEAVIRLHREPIKRRKTKKIARGLAYMKKK